MSGRSSDAEGFSLVEVVIAMLLLGLVAVAILPALWQGLTVASQQSSTATATRYMNALVEQARETRTCDYLGSIAGLPPKMDGRGRQMTTDKSTSSGCGSGATATLTVVVQVDGKSLATTTALILIP